MNEFDSHKQIQFPQEHFKCHTYCVFRNFCAHNYCHFQLMTTILVECTITNKILCYKHFYANINSQTMTIRKQILHNSTTSNSSSENTDSTLIQSGFVSSPIRKCNTFDNLTEKNMLTVMSNVTNQPHEMTKQSSFRKCQSFIHLSNGTEKIQSSLIDIEHSSDHIRKTISTPNAIYLAIKPELRLSMHRIVNRRKVILILLFCFGLLQSCRTHKPHIKLTNSRLVYSVCIGVLSFMI